jgi:hypothetical protein
MVSDHPIYIVNSGEDAVIKEVRSLLLQPDPKARQIRKATRLWKYVLRWTRKSFFLYVLRWFPSLDIPEHARKHYNLSSMYASMTKSELSNIIKRLEQIEKRNKLEPVPSSSHRGQIERK